MPPAPEPFWLCHECGAQMRPIDRNGVKQCASCQGEFLEILDAEVNPDPFHELPAPPPLRPQSSPPRTDRPSSPPTGPDTGGPGGFLQSMMSSLFAGLPAPQQPGHEGQVSGSTNQPTSGGSGRGGGPSGNGTRTFTFNVGGGRGQVMFGSFGGGGQNQGFGSPNPMDGGNLESFFPGFAPPPMGGNRVGGQAGPRGQHVHAFPPGTAHTHAHVHTGAMGPEDLMRMLFSVLAEDGHGAMGGIPGQANLGDYVMSENGFDQILEQLMHAAGPQGPLPASEVVIQGLPRSTFDENSLEKSAFKDCPVCKDDFAVGDEAMKVPCGHLFHPDCLQPWLRTNGSCPVCRFSLVPAEGNETPQPRQAPSSGTSPSQAGQSESTQGQNGIGSTVTNILQRLWGQGGSVSNPQSPSTTPSNPMSPASERPPTGAFGMGTSRVGVTPTFSPPPGPPPGRTHSETQYFPPSGPPPSQTQPNEQQSSTPLPQASGQSTQVERFPSAIPADYRERHRRREQEQQDQISQDDLD